MNFGVAMLSPSATIRLMCYQSRIFRGASTTKYESNEAFVSFWIALAVNFFLFTLTPTRSGFFQDRIRKVNLK